MNRYARTSLVIWATAAAALCLTSCCEAQVEGPADSPSSGTSDSGAAPAVKTLTKDDPNPDASAQDEAGEGAVLAVERQEDVDDEHIEVLEKLLDLSGAEDWAVQSLKVGDSELALALHEDIEPGKQGFRAAVVKDGEVVERNDDFLGFTGLDGDLLSDFDGCNWIGISTEPIDVAGSGGIKTTLECLKMSQGRQDQRSLVIIHRLESGRLGSLAEMNPVWTGTGGSTAAADGNCALTAVATFSVKAKALTRTLTFTSAPAGPKPNKDGAIEVDAAAQEAQAEEAQAEEAAKKKGEAPPECEAPKEKVDTFTID